MDEDEIIERREFAAPTKAGLVEPLLQYVSQIEEGAQRTQCLNFLEEYNLIEELREKSGVLTFKFTK